MASNKSTHTVRTVSRSLTQADSDFEDDFGAAPRAKEARRTLVRRMLLVVFVVILLLGLLAGFEFLTSQRPPVDAPSTPVAPKTLPQDNVPSINLEKLEAELNKRMEEAQSAAESPAPAPEPTPVTEAPARTPFDDLNFVESEAPPTPEIPVESEADFEEEPEDPNAPTIEQTITESGETILKITPKKPSAENPPATPNAQPRQKAAPTTPRPTTPAPRIEPENSANVPMQGTRDIAPPAQALQNEGRMPTDRYHVQAGIFVENARARALYQRLVSAGIPAVLESRVQVGPFNTRREAEAARQKLKTMGIDSIVIAPPTLKGEKK